MPLHDLLEHAQPVDVLNTVDPLSRSLRLSVWNASSQSSVARSVSWPW